MWLKDNFINTIDKKLHVYLQFENEKYLLFREIFKNNKYNEIKKQEKFKQLPDELKFNIAVLGPIRKSDIEYVISQCEEAESNFDIVFAENETMLNIYSKEMMLFLKNIIKENVFQYDITLKNTLKFIKSEKTIKDLKKEINNKINEILKEIDN